MSVTDTVAPNMYTPHSNQWAPDHTKFKSLTRNLNLLHGIQITHTKFHNNLIKFQNAHNKFKFPLRTLNEDDGVHISAMWMLQETK